jgi:hypothetical protein
MDTCPFKLPADKPSRRLHFADAASTPLSHGGVFISHPLFSVTGIYTRSLMTVALRSDDLSRIPDSLPSPFMRMHACDIEPANKQVDGIDIARADKIQSTVGCHAHCVSSKMAVAWVLRTTKNSVRHALLQPHHVFPAMCPDRRCKKKRILGTYDGAMCLRSARH